MADINALGVPSPTIDSDANVPDWIKAANDATMPMLVPNFGSEALRNAAFAIAQFRVCTIGNVLYLRRTIGGAGTWVTVLAGSDIDTGWLAATMQGTWSPLVAAPARYRISGGMVQWQGVAYRSDDVPGTSGMITVPSNAMPASANAGAGWPQNAHTKGVWAATLDNTATFVQAVLNLRKVGSLTCTIPGGNPGGIKLVPLWDLQWALSS